MLEEDPFPIFVLIEVPVPVGIAAGFIDAALIMCPAVGFGNGEGFWI